MINCSIGIMAYNEEANIEGLLQAISSQKSSVNTIDEIIVVSSGSTDRTEEIIRRFSKIDNRIKLIIQERRFGKASAINLFLGEAKNEICILQNSDTLPDKDAIENLIKPFIDPHIGMTGARPTSIDNPNIFMGFVVHLMWKLHHEISLRYPKMGELVAFRNVIGQIPEDSAVDEASIEAMITKRGYMLCYVPQAIVRIKGAETIKDFITQRRRIAAGHIWLRKTQSYLVSTRNKRRIFMALLREFRFDFKFIFFTFGAIFLECSGRLLGMYDYYIKRKNPYIWDIAETTKKVK